MLAVLVLAAITAIAFSLAAIVFIEIGASGDLLRTEPALYAASGVTEEAFNATTRNLSNFTFSTNINNVSLSTAPRNYDLSPQTYVIYYSGTTKLSLVDPDQPTAFSNSYTNVTLTYVSPGAGTAITVNLFQYQPNGQGGQVDTRDLTSSSPAWSINFASYANSSNSQFEMQLTTTAVSNATVSINSTRNRAGTPSSGLPVVGRKAYDVTASYLGLTRKYSVSGPLSTSSATDQALGKTATQSSTYNGITLASEAIDANTDGNYGNGSVAITNFDSEAWLQIDLGSLKTIQTIILWNRTDCCGNRLDNAHVFVSDSPFSSTGFAATQAQAGVSDYSIGTAAATNTINVGRTGRYVRVQLPGTNYLQLAEVQVMGN